MTTPHAPGAIGLTHIPGPAGWAITLGQILDGARPADAQWDHALIAVGDGTVVEARPDGAVHVPEADATGYGIVWWTPDATPPQGQDAATAALALVGTPYGWVDYPALALTRLHVAWPAVTRRAASDRTLICSQLVALAWSRAGVDLIPGRPPWQVTPADLARVARIPSPGGSRGR